MLSRRTYIALLRGINVGHHKVPMTDLRGEMEAMGFTGIVTLLNSGNVIFSGKDMEPSEMENQIAVRLEGAFGFPIPVLVRTGEEIMQLVKAQPFRDIPVTGTTRLYVTFLKQAPEDAITVARTSDDRSFRILGVTDRSVCSVLDLAISATPHAMEILERLFGRDITTRNWNTVEKIARNLEQT